MLLSYLYSVHPLRRLYLSPHLRKLNLQTPNSSTYMIFRSDGGRPRRTPPLSPLFLASSSTWPESSILTHFFDYSASQQSHLIPFSLAHSLLPFSSFTLLTFLHRNTTWSGVCPSFRPTFWALVPFRPSNLHFPPLPHVLSSKKRSVAPVYSFFLKLIFKTRIFI